MSGMMDVLAITDTSFSLLSTAYNITRWLWTTTKNIQNAPELWDEKNEAFIIDTKAKVDILIGIVKRLTSSSSCDQHIKTALNDLATKLEADSREIGTRLRDTQPTTRRDRVEFALRHDNSLQELLSRVETRTGRLLTWLHLLDLNDNLRVAKTGGKLEDDVLECHGRQRPIANATQLYTSKAEYKPLSEKVDVVVLVDKVEKKAIETVSGLLMQRIGSAGGGFAMGILPCLGYKGDKLMFRLPHNADSPKTLHTTVSEDVADGRVASLGQRFDLARQLAEAVFMLHSANLMHKNLRGDTFLLLQPKLSEPIPPKVVVTTNVTNGVEESDLKTSEERGRKPERPPEKWSIKRAIRSRSRRRQSNKETDCAKIEEPGNGGTDSKTTERNNSLSIPGRLEQWLPQDSTVAILTHWSEAKEHGEVSIRSGPLENEWQIKVYRHPSQQCKHPETAYNFGHDIYALGVCLLEIGLWNPLVHPGPAPSTNMLSVGGVASVNLLKKALKNAIDKGGSRAKNVVVSALKEEAGIAAASRLKKALDELKVDSNRETGRATAKELKGKIGVALKEERYHGVSYRLRGALVEIVMDQALKEEGDGSATLSTAKGLRRAVEDAVKDKNAEKLVKAIAHRLRTAAEGMEGDANVMMKASEAMDLAVSKVEKEMGVGAEVLRVAQRMEKVVNDKIQKSRQDESPVGPRIVRDVKLSGKKDSYMATVDELNSLLKENGGEALRCALIGLANHQLPPTMGVDYTRLVVKCLEIFENGFGKKIDFKKVSQEEVCIDLETHIVAPLRRVNLGE